MSLLSTIFGCILGLAVLVFIAIQYWFYLIYKNK